MKIKFYNLRVFLERKTERVDKTLKSNSSINNTVQRFILENSIKIAVTVECEESVSVDCFRHFNFINAYPE